MWTHSLHCVLKASCGCVSVTVSCLCQTQHSDGITKAVWWLQVLRIKNTLHFHPFNRPALLRKQRVAAWHAPSLWLSCSWCYLPNASQRWVPHWNSDAVTQTGTEVPVRPDRTDRKSTLSADTSVTSPHTADRRSNKSPPCQNKNNNKPKAPKLNRPPPHTQDPIAMYNRYGVLEEEARDLDLESSIT